MNNKPILFNLNDAQLVHFVEDMGQPRFRAKQIRDWLMRGAESASVMKNLPESFRNDLDKIADMLPVKIDKKLESSDGATTKFLLRLEDDSLIETVLMKTTYGTSICVSSQVGCAMGCRFCASTLLGLKRNLTMNEMVAQVLITGADITHIVIMGTGEPLYNTQNVFGFLEFMHREKNISWRRMTISTCGIVPGINEIIEWNRPISLAISLHASNDEMRNKIMPINSKYKIAEVLDAAFAHSEKTGRQLMIEYIVFDTSDENEALELSKLLNGKNVMVNLIPWNAIGEREFNAPSGNALHRFQDVLIKNGIHTRIRKERGADIDSACGQLRIEKGKK